MTSSMSPRSDGLSRSRKLRNPLRQIDHLRGKRLPARERQELARQVLAALRSARDHVEIAHVVGVALAAQQALDAAGDDREQIVEIVRHAAGQLPDRLHALPLAERRLGDLAPLGFLVQLAGAGEREREAHHHDRRRRQAERQAAQHHRAPFAANDPGLDPGAEIDRTVAELSRGNAPLDAVDGRE